MFRREPPLTDKVSDLAFQEVSEAVRHHKLKSTTLAPYLLEIDVSHLPNSVVKNRD